MKRIKILLLLFFLVTGFSVNAMSLKPGPSRNYEGHEDNDHRDNDHKDKDRDKDKDKDKDKHKHKHKGGDVGVPLDGGLLTVLGVGGVAYYVARKKGKKPES